MSKIEQLAILQKLYKDETMLATEKEAVHESWFNENTTDFWRHQRMYETIRPLADYYAGSPWLTVGDGRFGLDAIRLKKIFPLKHIFPTDIGENMLRISKEKGYIYAYGIENAEQLSFADSSYDIVFCKDAFHHFPRPYLALYEMLRVSKKAVVMIEAAERMISNGVKSISLFFRLSYCCFLKFWVPVFILMYPVLISLTTHLKKQVIIYMLYQ